MILPYHPSLVDPDTTGVPCSIFRGTSLPLQASKHPPEAPGKDAGIGALLTGTCSDPRVSAAADDRGVGGSKRPLDGEAEGSTYTRLLAIFLATPTRSRTARGLTQKTGIGMALVLEALDRLVAADEVSRITPDEVWLPFRYRRA